MQNGQKTIRELFDGSKIFNIPQYQRAYAWEEKQLEDFVDDIENQKLDKAYFFGTILFQEKEMSDGFDNIDIVDGQQRITTLIIFMKLLLDRLREHGDKQEIDRLNDRYIKLYDEYKLRVLHDDNDFFKSYILQENSSPGDEVRTPSQGRLLEAKERLRQRIERYQLETLLESKEKIERTKVLTYSVEGDAEATLIFETTNDRGKSLTNLEKTKSFLMYKTYLASDCFATRLADLQSRFSEIYRDYEEIKDRVEEDSILQYHVIAFEKWANRGDYQQPVQMIKQRVTQLVNADKKSEAWDFIDRCSLELKESFTVMKQLLLNTNPHLIDIFALNRPAVFYPLLVKVYKLDGPDKQNFKRVARLVEIICFRVFGIRRRRADTGREQLYKMARAFNGKFDELIDHLKKFVDDYCNNDDFSGCLSSSSFYKDLDNTNDQRYLFWKYENHLRTKERPLFSEMSHDEFANSDSQTKFSIEHIIPQNPEERKVVEDKSILPEMTQEFQDKYLHCIGNLTIDPLAANISKSNHSFEHKDQKYFRRAPLKTQNELSEFINRETGRWDETSIGQRTEKILEFAKNHWNHNAV